MKCDMLPKMRCFAFLIATAFCVCGCAKSGGEAGNKAGPTDYSGASATASADVGKAAPSFHLADIQGKPITSSSLRGKVVLVDFWASWCAPCIAAMPDIERLQQKFAKNGLVVLGVTLDDDDAKLKHFLAQRPANYPVVKPDPAFNVNYGTLLHLKGNHLVGSDKLIWANLPSWILIDRHGRVAAIYKSSSTEKQMLQEAEALASRA
jgi:thiol-disulfide isomerase/thioredoxin